DVGADDGAIPRVPLVTGYWYTTTHTLPGATATGSFTWSTRTYARLKIGAGQPGTNTRQRMRKSCCTTRCRTGATLSLPHRHIAAGQPSHKQTGSPSALSPLFSLSATPYILDAVSMIIERIHMV